MVKLSVQQKEQLIIGTILSCNNEIKKISQIMPKLNENMRNNMYHFNMTQLFSEINPLFENGNQIPDEAIFVKNSRGNYYAYFQKVYDFLDGYEVNLQKNLNESLKVDETLVQNPIQIDILTFKQDLKNIIIELSKKNDLNNISPEVLKIKTLANKPILINGFDISNNVALRKELFDNFNISFGNLIAICFDKSNQQLLFVTDNTKTLVVYDLKKDELNFYNSINEKIKPVQLTPKNYSQTIKDLTDNNNIIDLYVNVSMLKLDFTDNLFSDNARQKFIDETQKQQASFSIIKKGKL